MLMEHSSQAAVRFLYLPRPSPQRSQNRQYLAQVEAVTNSLGPTLLIHGVTPVTSTDLFLMKNVDIRNQSGSSIVRAMFCKPLVPLTWRAWDREPLVKLERPTVFRASRTNPEELLTKQLAVLLFVMLVDTMKGATHYGIMDCVWSS
ncbi:hypothetical protein F7725_006572 [Dissostichus mawsoni]|uniref:Uncharacterized protein n=1 Tax=Dissostichus mawsoni TaxID=36200 RepID=A0A7J5XUA5_DISMA|nr:hypothetical protein F7725_006572 [Dissostichus mawsoni]